MASGGCGIPSITTAWMIRHETANHKDEWVVNNTVNMNNIDNVNNRKRERFVVSLKGALLAAKTERLFLAEPFVEHQLMVRNIREQYAGITIGPFVRRNQHDLKIANDLLWDKYQKYLPLIAQILNGIHGLEHSTDFWRRTLSMGLMRHLTLLYDHFLICENSFNSGIHDAFVLAPEDYYLPVNYDEHRWFFQHAGYGQEQLFSLYMQQFYPGLGQEYHDEYKSIYTQPVYAGNAAANPEIGVMRALFSSQAIQRLYSASGGRIATVGYSGSFPVSPMPDWEKRQMLNASEEWFDRFDQFFFYTLPALLPRQFVEDYLAVEEIMSSQLSRYTRLRYVVSETFIGESYESIALALLNERGVKIIYHEHNYAEYPFYATIIGQQTSFADIFAAHGNYHTPIASQISAGSMFEFIDPGLKFPRDINNDILYTSGIGTAKYSNYSHSFAETAENALEYYAYKLAFFETLGDDVLEKILYRSYPVDSNSENWTLAYNDDYLMRRYLPKMRIDDHSQSNKNRMMHSRLVIVDYLSTSHYESMSMNIPTVILIRPDSYMLNEQNRNFFDELTESGICQTDPIKAAMFISSIQRNPEDWWFSSKVQKAKNSFLEKNLGRPETFHNYLMNLLKENKTSTGDAMKTPLALFIEDKNGVMVPPSAPKEFKYSDGQEREQKVLNIIRAASDKSIFSIELQKNVSDWVTEYHFSRERHNLLRHVGFQPDWNILELGCGCGAITRQLGESGASVTAIEGSYSRAAAAAARCRDLPNVKVCNSNFQDVQLAEKYDVVTLIGVMEYSPLYFTSDDPIRECLEIAFNALKPEGVLIIAIENQIGLKYFSGYHEDHVDIPYFGIEDRYNKKTAITFGKQELSDILKQAGFSTVEFQYPFPDYKVPKIVITPKGFSNRAFHPEDILCQLTYRDYSGPVNPSFEQGLAIPVLCRNGVMADLSNSFLVFASPSNKLPDSVQDDNLLGVYYTTDRAGRYNILTRFEESGQSVTVKKSSLIPGAVSKASIRVLDQKLGEDVYVAGNNLEFEYRKCLVMKDLDRFSDLVSMQVEFIEREGIKKRDPDNPANSEVKDDFFDCVPSNLILKNGEFHLIDREWISRKRISMGVLLLRTVDVLCNLEPKLPEISRNNLIFSLHEAGYTIDERTEEEYNNLNIDIVAQVYKDEMPKPREIDNPIWNALLGVRADLISRKNLSPEMDVVINRLCSHLDEMLAVYNGYRPRGNYERLQTIGRANEVEINIIDQFIKIIREAPDWSEVYKFLNALKDEINEELRLSTSIPKKIEKINSPEMKEQNITAQGNDTEKPRARVIAFYLPQFHPIPENDLWWGKGFTEWSNVGKAKPLFEGHYQPHVPADLGYYDLRIAEARNAQAELAKQYGIEAFCYWHYWFAGKRLLERPFNDVIALGEPDFPFCLGWANQTWSGVWHGAPNKILIEQTYPGLEDYKAHFYALLPAFRDKRALKINGKIVFLIYSPQNLPDAPLFVNCWQELAQREGLPGFHFIAHMVNNPEKYNCDSCVDNAPFYTMNAPLLPVKPLTPAGVPKVSDYMELVKYLKNYKLKKTEHPIVFPNWDNTPRSGVNGVVLINSTPELFAEMMRDAVQKAETAAEWENRIVFVKAWNEWAEGNHLEPDMQYGHAYLQAVKDAVLPVIK